MTKLEGRRVLIVEDEFLIAFELRLIIEDEGAEVIEADSVKAGLDAVAICVVNGGLPAVAVLDVRLDGEEVFPVADKLLAEGVPFVFHSGHAKADELSERYPQAGVLSKPARAERLVGALERRVAV